MSVYNGFGTRQQQSEYNKTLYKALFLIQLRVQKALKGEKFDDHAFMKHFSKLHHKLFEMESYKYLPPKFSYAMKDLAQYFGVLDRYDRNSLSNNSSHHSFNLSQTSQKQMARAARMHPQDAINQVDQPFMQASSKQFLHPNSSTTPQRYAYGQQHSSMTPMNNKYKGRSLASNRTNNQFSPPSLYNSGNGAVAKRSKNQTQYQMRNQNRTASRRLTSTRGSSNGNSQYNSQQQSQQQQQQPMQNKQNIVSMPGKPVPPLFMPPIGSKEMQRRPGQSNENSRQQQNKALDDISPTQATQIKLGSASSNNTKSRGNNAKHPNNANMIDSFQNKQKIGSPNTTINNNNIIININKSYNVKNQADMEEGGGENEQREARNEAAIQAANISGMLKQDSPSNQKNKPEENEQKQQKQQNSDQKGPSQMNESMLNHSLLRQLEQTGTSAIDKQGSNRRNELQQFKMNQQQQQPQQQRVKAGNIFSKRSLSPKNQRNINPQFEGNNNMIQKRMSGTTPVSRMNHNNAHHLVSLPDPSPHPHHHHNQHNQQQMYSSLQYQNPNDFSMNDRHSYQHSGYGQRKVSRNNGNYFNQRNSPMSNYNQDLSDYHQHHHHQYTPEIRSESPGKYRGHPHSYYQGSAPPGHIGGAKIKRKLPNGMTIDGVRNDFEKNFVKMKIKNGETTQPYHNKSEQKYESNKKVQSSSKPKQATPYDSLKKNSQDALSKSGLLISFNSTTDVYNQDKPDFGYSKHQEEKISSSFNQQDSNKEMIFSDQQSRQFTPQPPQFQAGQNNTSPKQNEMNFSYEHTLNQGFYQELQEQQQALFKTNHVGRDSELVLFEHEDDTTSFKPNATAFSYIGSKKVGQSKNSPQTPLNRFVNQNKPSTSSGMSRVQQQRHQQFQKKQQQAPIIYHQKFHDKLHESQNYLRNLNSLSNSRKIQNPLDLFEKNSNNYSEEDASNSPAAIMRGDQRIVFHNQIPSNNSSNSQKLAQQQIYDNEFNKRTTYLSKHKRSNHSIREQDSSRFSSTSRNGGPGLASRRSNSNMKRNQTALRGSRQINTNKYGNFYAHKGIKNRRATTSGDVNQSVNQSENAVKRSLIINSNRRQNNSNVNRQMGNKIIVHKTGQPWDYKRIQKQQQTVSKRIQDTHMQGSRIQGLRRLAAANNSTERGGNISNYHISPTNNSNSSSSKALTANQRRMEYHQNLVQKRGSKQEEPLNNRNNNQIINNEMHYRLHTNSQSQFTTFNEETQIEDSLNRSVELQREVKNLKNARRDKLNNYNINSVDKEILKMKKFLVNTSANEFNNNSSAQEIMNLIDGERVDKSVREFKKIEEINKSKGSNSPMKKQFR